MKQLVLPCMLMLCCIFTVDLIAQEDPVLATFEEREELTHILRLSNGNFLLSGKTFELGNKSDLVVLLDPNGNEIRRKAVCHTCSFGDIVYSKETSDGEIVHIRSSGDIFFSDLNLGNSRFLINVKNNEFEFVETYQVLENANFIVVVSFAVKDGIRGLLHTTINTLSERLISSKFNTHFPDIDGSIGIGLFQDVGVVDGYNSVENGRSTGHLLRYDISRELLWDVDLDWANISLDHVLVSWSQQVYAVGTIEDEENPGHLQGYLVSFSQEGDLLWEKRFDSPSLDESGVANPVKGITRIKQLRSNEFVMTGKNGGVRSGKEFGEAFVLKVDEEGNKLVEFITSGITDDSEALDAIVVNPGDRLLFVARSFSTNGIAGSFFSLASTVTSAFAPLPAEITIFPNPTSDYLIINDTESIHELDIKVFDTTGQMVFSSRASNFLDISHLENGTYYLQITKGTKRYFHVFIKQ